MTLFIPNPDGSTIDIARIDTADAGVHFDRLYLPEAHPRRKDYGVTVLDYREAQRILVKNWRGFVTAYDDHHGLR